MSKRTEQPNCGDEDALGKQKNGDMPERTVMSAPTVSESAEKEDRRTMRANRKIRRANERWQSPSGWWLSRIPLLMALFVALLGFSFVVLGLVGSIIDPTGVELTLGAYLRGHGRFVGAAALIVTTVIFARILSRQDKSGLTLPRLTGSVAALTLFDAASLAIAVF